MNLEEIQKEMKDSQVWIIVGSGQDRKVVRGKIPYITCKAVAVRIMNNDYSHDYERQIDKVFDNMHDATNSLLEILTKELSNHIRKIGQEAK